MSDYPKSLNLLVKDMLHYEKNLWNSRILDIAGIDEAGRGPLAGPVVAAAVIMHDISISGIRDSKQLNAEKRERLYESIMKRADSVGIGIVEASVIDEINIFQATLRAMKMAVHDLKVKPQHILVDGRHMPETNIPGTAIVRGDQKSYLIASASIVAKVTRDRMMFGYDRMYPMYGFAKHKGYGTADHISALRKHGPSPIHRRSFHIKNN
ncbi:ribonuclease HII [bacterium]|nr:ribonuclease HII [bacterium]